MSHNFCVEHISFCTDARGNERFILRFSSLFVYKIKYLFYFSLFLPQASSLKLVDYITTMRQRKNCFRSCYWQNCINKCWKHTSTLSFWDLKYLLSRLLWCFSEHWWYHTAVKLKKSAVIGSRKTNQWTLMQINTILIALFSSFKCCVLVVVQWMGLGNRESKHFKPNLEI